LPREIWVSAVEISHKKNLRSNVPLFENLPHQQPFLKGKNAVSDLGKISRIYSQNMSARTVRVIYPESSIYCP
jgi:hypothetical protein